MPLSDTLDGLSAQKKPFIFYKLSSVLDRKKKGSNVYYVANFTVDKEATEFNEDDQELLHYFSDLVDKENKYVMSTHDKALINKGIVVDGDTTIVDDLDDAFNQDLDATDMLTS